MQPRLLVAFFASMSAKKALDRLEKRSHYRVIGGHDDVSPFISLYSSLMSEPLAGY
jgi:hypothetical protein